MAANCALARCQDARRSTRRTELRHMALAHKGARKDDDGAALLVWALVEVEPFAQGGDFVVAGPLLVAKFPAVAGGTTGELDEIAPQRTDIAAHLVDPGVANGGLKVVLDGAFLAPF